MFPKIVISAFLIAAGGVSPWLVKDWTNWEKDEARANRFYDQVSEYSDRFSNESVGNKSDGGGSGSESSGSFFAKARQMLGGILPEVKGAGARTTRPMTPDASGHSADAAHRSAISVGSSKRVVGDLEPVLKADMSRIGLKPGDPIFIRIFKEERELELWMKGGAKSEFTLFKVYRIVDFSGGLGPKLKEGDRQAPEGFYYISPSRLYPETRHYLGIDLGYPNEYDRFHGRSGSDVMIHGGSGSAGSYVLKAADMNEVFTLASLALESGQRFFRVNAFPFRMTDRRMAKEWKERSQWTDFWVELKEGYDFFENVNVPPDVRAGAGSYVFNIP